MAKCTRCNAEILWIKMRSGKSMPVDPGHITVVTDAGTVVKGYAPHWGSCPYADEFKSPRKGR